MLLHQPHHRDRGNQLGDRRDPHRIVGGDGAAGRQVGDAGGADRGLAVPVERDPHGGDRLRGGEEQRP